MSNTQILPQPPHAEIVRILGRFHGAKKELAKRANVAPCTVTSWLVGATSANIAAKALELYWELRSEEQTLAKTA